MADDKNGRKYLIKKYFIFLFEMVVTKLVRLILFNFLWSETYFMFSEIIDFFRGSENVRLAV